MIYTVTLNPAIDVTLEVETLVPGGTHRVLSRCRYPGGKGLNAARALGVFLRIPEEERNQRLGLENKDEEI